jgi:hypothetical protein
VPRTKPEVEVKRLNVILPRDLHDQFKAAASAEGKQMTEVLMEFIQDYIRRHGVEPRKERGR